MQRNELPRWSDSFFVGFARYIPSPDLGVLWPLVECFSEPEVTVNESESYGGTANGAGCGSSSGSAGSDKLQISIETHGLFAPGGRVDSTDGLILTDTSNVPRVRLAALEICFEIVLTLLWEQ